MYIQKVYFFTKLKSYEILSGIAAQRIKNIYWGLYYQKVYNIVKSLQKKFINFRYQIDSRRVK